MSTTHYLAVDLGAESGRVMLGTLDQGRLSLDEIHRFPNHVVAKGDSLFWDLAQLEKEMKEAARALNFEYAAELLEHSDVWQQQFQFGALRDRFGPLPRDEQGLAVLTDCRQDAEAASVTLNRQRNAEHGGNQHCKSRKAQFIGR